MARPTAPPAGVPQDRVRPPKSAGARLWGCPSALAASPSNASRESGEPRSALPATSPPTQAAALEPRPREVGMRFTHASSHPVNARPAASYASFTPRATTLPPSRARRSAPSPSIFTLARSPSSATTSLWSASASPSASKPGPRFADVAGMRTWTRTRLQPLEEPVRGEGDGPGVQDHVVVGEDEDSDDDEDDARRPLDHGNEPTITLEEREKRSERRRRDQKR